MAGTSCGSLASDGPMTIRAWFFILNLKSNFLGVLRLKGSPFQIEPRTKWIEQSQEAWIQIITADLANKLINFQFSCWTRRFSKIFECHLRSFKVNFCFLNFYLFGNIFIFVQMVLKTNLEDLKVWENIKLSLLLALSLSSDAVNHLWPQMSY